MRVLVCGSREFENYDFLYIHLAALRALTDEEIVIIHGAARGADSLADRAGRALGYAVLPFPADWAQYGKRAGIVRNQQMLDEGHPDMVIAFTPTAAYTPGTHDMVDRATRAGIPCHHLWSGADEPDTDQQDS